MVHLWLRAETKKNEERAALTPLVCKKLIENGFKITVERSKQRIFKDQDYESIHGIEMAEEGSWKEKAPLDAYVMALKELPEHDDSPLKHKHIFFAHCYKHQAGWKELLRRFEQGKGEILDLEFLKDSQGRRVAAFGYHAGFAGAAVGLMLWAHQQLLPGTPFPGLKSFPNEQELIQYVKKKVEMAIEKYQKKPKVMVMGALGRCGTGSCDFVQKILPSECLLKWDMKETAKGGPFIEILQNEIFINDIYLSQPIPPFVNQKFMVENDNDRKLSVFVDVSCDATNPHNPVPIYNGCTTFSNPVLSVRQSLGLKSQVPLDVVAIDHLPSLLPKESSESFCEQLLPTLLTLKNREKERVWTEVAQLFNQKIEEMRASQ